MARAVPSYRPKETRVREAVEVSLGFNKKVAQEEARRCPQCAVATCLPGCPLGIDIPGFIRLLREGDTNGALERIRKDNPFAAICGRVCPAPCEESCVFHADGNPIAVRELERFAADHGALKPEKMQAAAGSKKVAVIGSGPAGMSAAYYLAKSNLSVTIFEAAHLPGGILCYGIPEFRLPQKVLDDEFRRLKLLGVEVRTDAVFGRTLMLDEIFMSGFSAVLLAIGAGLPRFSELNGMSLSGVYYDSEFLNRAQSIGKEKALDFAIRQGMPAPKTVVVGRGPSAFDAARFASRLGSEVTVVLDGFEEEAGVGADILQESREEGVGMLSMQAVEMTGDGNGYVAGVKCRKLDIVEGEKGLRLELSKEDPVVLEAQCVIMANGHRPGGFLRQYLPHLKWEAGGFLWTDGQTGMTSVDKVFGCGSVAGAGETLLASLVSGKAVARKIADHLGRS
ncbi:MAG: FAD-dependent oxidoreductase [Candidatus Omnitrophica bacterium]|nr:FAD-dependent oxidoreductase [Candidatus Omnitrophota bacterium]